MPGPVPPFSPGATAATPLGRPQSRGPAHHPRQGRGHGHCAGAGALSRGVFHACSTTAFALAGIAGLASGALSALPRAGPRRPVPSRRAPLFAAPAPLASRAFSQFLLFSPVFEAEPVALGERLGGCSFPLALSDSGFFVHT